MLGWVASYRRAWLRPDVLAGVVIWSVVVPQCVAYAQIAGLRPEAGLMAAPGALIAYALIGTSRSLVVSATTATSAVSAAAVGPLAHGDMARFAALSAALALVTGGVLLIGGFLKVGAVSDFVNKPVMTGMMFGIGLIITVDQLPALLGIDAPSGGFFHKLAKIVDHLGDVDATTLIVGLTSIAALLACKRLIPSVPATAVVLILAITVSAALSLDIDTIGKLPTALPKLAWPDVSWSDAGNLLPSAFGILVVSAEAVGVARSLATKHGYEVDPNRDLSAMGVSNLAAGISSGFVQSGGASQTAAADTAGGKTQLATLVAAALVLLTGAFLSPIFTDLPRATLAAIVIVAVFGFYRVDELRRFARLRTSAIVLSLLTLAGVLTLGVLRGLIVAAGLSLVIVIQRLSRPPVVPVIAPDGTVTARIEGALFYANAVLVKDEVRALAKEQDVHAVTVNLRQSFDLDVETLDALAELSRQLDLTLINVRPGALERLKRAGLDGYVRGS